MFSQRSSLAGVGVLLRLFRKLEYCTAATARGTTRRGPRKNSLFIAQIWLSPPVAVVSIRIARTLVFQPPTIAPSSLRSGTPMQIEEMLVLVPPTSITAQVSSPERYEAPTRLAAGPEKIVSMGFFRASLIPTTEPSHLSIRSRALIPLSLISVIIDCTNCLVMGINWALRKAVTALS